MSLTLQQALMEGTSRLREAGIETARLDAGILLVHVLGQDREILYRAPEQELSSEELDRFRQLIDRRVDREPVSHLIGRREFWSREFHVDSRVLDPRPDSETLIAAALEFAAGQGPVEKILDLGTGSGCLLLTLLAELPGTTGTGVDISAEALEVTRKNVALLGLEARTTLLQGRWFEPVTGQFDLVISNPPYIETDDIARLQEEVRRFEPLGALDGGPDGLDCYRKIIGQLKSYLADRGMVIFEVGAGQADDVGELLSSAGFTTIRVHDDLSGIGRCVSAVCKK
ncbi:peptide chain release factor N(5)-glutamine methyltransferase [Sneathiella chinensis]|uniref:Release factor glutamine methyltransferase n=1 Tax=Sneathiella chinensis TaxID=349750 RepID=A0ABQ5U9G0_9PROT|nr:peptide chain release factor N(5)-glutamine methyltransferase [Sneathiella chinensis]GLQ08061.1 release factor glutamine methyltransferase [Sneathiella chinensis]